jgi:Putative phage serine protease XkdF
VPRTTVRPDGTVTVETGTAKAAATWDGETIATQVIKADAERRYTLNVIYPADKADVAVALDGHRDFASKAVVEDAAWAYMRNYRQVGVAHSPEHAASMGTAFKAADAAEVVESYIYRGPDWTIEAADGSQVVIKAGDWLGGFIWSPEAWADIKGGKINGVSPEGGARRRKPSPDAIANLRD